MTTDTLGGPMTQDVVKLRGRLRIGHYEIADPLVGLGPVPNVGTRPLWQFEVSVDRASRRVRVVLKQQSSAIDPRDWVRQSPATTAPAR